ncbi:MAG: DMT family transporter [Bacillota bacterium]|nr:DMT family transporter [Bacillota bacterium]
MLIIVTIGWGVSYFMMDICLQQIEPLTLNAIRFLGAFAVAAILTYKNIKTVNLMTLKYAFYISISLVFVYLGATYGLKYTSQSNAGFFCATSTVFTPILAFLIKKVRPDKKLLLVIVTCTIGIALMSFKGEMKIAIGDLLCLMCGLAYGFDLLITETGVSHEEVDAFQVGVFQLGFTGLWMLGLSLIFETPTLPSTPGCWISLIFLSIFCTGIAFIAQAVAQQYTTATHVGIIFALEPVFAAIVAFLFAGERLMGRAYLGAVLMLISILLMEVDVKSIFARNTAKAQEPVDK